MNTALPTGGISVTEYNLYNDVIRTLSPDNRLKAITEGCKANEECKSATENTYEEKGTEPGTELLSTLGPQHTVKLAVGKEGKVNEEAPARERTNYYYNEGAPTEGGPYHLVTKTIDSAETASKEEFDKRTTETSYSGQSGLGWKLRKPTSVITDPSGLDLVHTTGIQLEYGQMSSRRRRPRRQGRTQRCRPRTSLNSAKRARNRPAERTQSDCARPPMADVWVTDLDKGNSASRNSRSSGSYVGTFGAAGKGNGQLNLDPSAVAVEGSQRERLGIAWTHGDTEQWIEEFNRKHEYVSQFGTEGTAGGQFKEPKAIAVDRQRHHLCRRFGQQQD